MSGRQQQAEADAEAVNCADASEPQAGGDAEESRASQRIADLSLPSASIPEPRTGLENEPEQDDRAARLDELLARADQAARRIAAQQAERQASSDYAARIEREAEPQPQAGQQAEARDDVELQLLRRGSSAFPDEPVDQVVQQGCRLCLAPARIGQDPACRVRCREREEQPLQVRLNGASQDPVRGELIPGQARPDQPGSHRVQLTGLGHPAHRAACPCRSAAYGS
jgi:hypothetical protein